MLECKRAKRKGAQSALTNDPVMNVNLATALTETDNAHEHVNT